MQHTPIARKRRGFLLAVSVCMALLLVPFLAEARPKNKIPVCHIPPGNPSNFHTIYISENALDAHLAHGDVEGTCDTACEKICDDKNPCTVDACFEGTLDCLPEEQRELVDCTDGDPSTRDSCDAAEKGCVNLPITAEPQDVFTDGAASLEFTLRGNDPSKQDLTFSITQGPDASKGTLSGPVPIVPAPIPDGQGGYVQPPITSATVIYTPLTEDNLQDSFEFKVQVPETPEGVGFATAVVSINPLDTPEPPPSTVEAKDVSAATGTDTPVTVTLRGAAPDDVSLTFITPLNTTFGGTLSDLSQGTEFPRRSATVTYTPASGFVGADTFAFDACDQNAPTVCATATATVNTIDLATDQAVQTNLNQPVTINLGNVQAAFLLEDVIAGNVSDADQDGLGDGRDNLPGPTPVLIAAGVDVNLSSQSFDDEATFKASLVESNTYDFEESSGFPPSGDVIGPFDGIDFDAKTYASNQATSGEQTMTGSGDGAGTFTSATIDFTGLEIQPNAFGFFGLDLTQGEIIRVTVDYANGPHDVFDVQLAEGAPAYTPTYFAFYNTSRTIDQLTFFGTDSQGGDRAWLIDDLTVGRRSRVAGVARIQIEWDISSLPVTSSDEIESATVTLTTLKGDVDDLETFFFVGTGEQDGVLTVSDFQAPANELSGVVMPVPDVPTGTEGTFSFDVTNQLKAAIDQGLSFFSIQGRVDEGLAGGGFRRGLQIRSTATGNLEPDNEPQLEVVTTGTTYKILSLPSNGTLFDGFGNPIAANQQIGNTKVTYHPNDGFSGTDIFTYQIGSDTATVTIKVLLTDGCVEVGRPSGCAPGQPQP